MSTVIGLTGPTGAGKSSIMPLAEKLGFFTVDCDKVAREESKNKEMLKSLANFFGDDIIKNGELCRKTLAQRAFSSPENTEKLNEITLPFISAKIMEIIKEKDKVILDAPTLFESGLHKICTATVCVLADENLRKTRIIKRDNLTEYAAKTRLFAAKTDEFFVSNCDYTVYNNGERDMFLKNAEEILKKFI